MQCTTRFTASLINLLSPAKNMDSHSQLQTETQSIADTVSSGSTTTPLIGYTSGRVIDRIGKSITKGYQNLVVTGNAFNAVKKVFPIRESTSKSRRDHQDETRPFIEIKVGGGVQTLLASIDSTRKMSQD